MRSQKATSELPTPYPFLLEVDGYTKIEVAALGEVACIDALIEHAVACREFGVVACVLGNGKHIVALAPY